MINLAGHKNPDPIVEEELFVAGVEIERLPHAFDGEVRTHITGRLGKIVFHRAWYYWVAEGPVPLATASFMYEQRPYGRRDVRVAGHCGCPSPEDPWLTYRDKDGREIHYLHSENDLKLYTQFRDGTIEEYMGNVLGPLFRGETGPIVFSKEERDALAASITVESYHIDSLGGLKVFADAIRPR
jgi:hypothetical protein